MYKITKAIRAAAKKIGVSVKPSKNPKKKLDAYDVKTGEFIASFGATGYNDYHIYMREHGKAYADKKKQNYWKRHQKDASKKYKDGKLTRGYLAARVLW